MHSDRNRGHLEDILENIDLATEFLGELGAEELSKDRMRLYAIIRCLEIVSEASRRLDAELKLRHPDVNWRAAATAGNIYRHEYDVVQSREIWRTVTESLPQMRVAIAHELAD